MPPPHSRNDLLQVVVVTVCLERQQEHHITEAIARMPWLVDVSHLDSYSSATRRPAFGPQMNAADMGIAFIDFSQNVDQAIDCARYLVQTFGSKLVIVAVGEEERSDLILEAMRAGYSEYLTSPLEDRVVMETLRRFDAKWSGKLRRLHQNGTVLAILGAKGGVGTTMLASHLAYYLTAQHGKRVLLVDTQPELGHVSIYLGLDGAQCTFAEVVRNVNRLDSDLLQGFVGKHASGLAVLSSPDQTGSARLLEHSAVAKTLEFLRSEYDYVVIDCDRSFGDLTRTVLEAASRIYLVATPDVGAIRDLSRYIDRILQNSEAQDRLHVVMNRATSDSRLDLSAVEKALSLPITIRISNNYSLLVQAGNAGRPVPPQSKEPVAAEMKRWASSLVQLPQTQDEVAQTRKAKPRWSLFDRGRTRPVDRSSAA